VCFQEGKSFFGTRKGAALAKKCGVGQKRDCDLKNDRQKGWERTEGKTRQDSQEARRGTALFSELSGGGGNTNLGYEDGRK